MRRKDIYTFFLSCQSQRIRILSRKERERETDGEKNLLSNKINE